MVRSSRLPGRSDHAVPWALGTALLFWTLAAAPSVLRGDEPAVRSTPTALVETEPVPSQGDAADDPAIWLHPDKPELSLVLGTDKKGGLNVFDLDGRRVQIISDGCRPNNVDVIQGFPLGEQIVDVAVAGTRNKAHPGIAFWQIDPKRRRLIELGPIPAFTVFAGGEPYGSCVYKSPRDQAHYVFVTSKDGDVEQYRLRTDRGASIGGDLVRSVRVGSTTEGCVADRDLSWVYFAEEKKGIWRYGAEPGSGSARTLVARVGEHGLAADVEGLTIYYAAGSKGYLIASSQGAGTFQVYERDDPHAFVLSIDPSGGAIGDVSESDGIDVTNAFVSPRFPRGLFVCQDGKARDGRQNFKYFAWDQIAGDRLIVDTNRVPHSH
jgi:3-phytase